VPVAQGGEGDGCVALALDVPRPTAGGGVFVGDDIAALVPGAAVPLDLVEPGATFEEPADEPLKIVGGEVVEMVEVAGVRVNGHRCSSGVRHSDLRAPN
jgi:hypothetical protein